MQNSNLPSKKISVIIVNYRSDQYLEKCIASLYNFEKDVDFEIIIVNNDGETRLDRISALFPAVKIIQNEENLGFGRATNLGAKKAVGEMLLFLNPDSKLKEELFAKVQKEFAEIPEMAVLSPKIVSSQGESQAWIFGKKMNLWQLLKNNLGLSAQKECTTRRETEWVSGTGMFVWREIFEKVGGFDEHFFLYFEDMDLCVRIKKLGRKIFYFPGAELVHVGSGSRLENQDRKKEYYASQDYYFQKHYGAFQAWLVRIIRKVFV